MSFIPTHYSNRYINQRYNKALYIVQHLPSSSNVQPTKDQKLELYALYKQVSHGDIDTQRPGIFDVVGRAKWDAWKRLEGISEMEAKHRYVETLLQAAKEAYKKPAGRAQAHQIIQSFAVMQPSGESGDSSSEDDQDDDDERDEDESSMGSAEAEERAYLRQVQRSTPMMNRRPLPPPSAQQKARWQQEQRSSSRASSQSGRMSMMTAPSELRRLSISSSSNSTPLRPVSAASARSGLDMSKRGGIQQQRMAKRELYEDSFDDGVNPWVLHPSSRQYRVDEVPSMQQRDSQQDLSALYRSPMSTTSSSATATQQQYLSLNSQQQQQQQHEQTVLGPATKRALEALQQEIEALNERINGLRKELVARDTISASKRLVKSSDATSNGDEDGWKWVFKAAMKHAMMNLLTASILLLFLYKKQSPVAHAILGVLQRILAKFKLGRFLISKMVLKNDTNK